MISIITPAYNQSLYIADCIDSVLSQSYQHFEFIIINDGSTDSTEEIVLSFKDDRIVYICQENQGVSAARNAGLMQMRGDYFCFLDADDIMPPASLESRLVVFRSNPKLDFVDGSVHYYDTKLEVLLKEWKPSFRGQPLKDLISLSGKSFFGPTWMIRRKPNIHYRFNRKLTHGEDLLFYIEIAKGGGFYDFTNEVILHYRMGHQSAMKNLKGLESGYRSICLDLESMFDLPKGSAESFRRKSLGIMFRSYMGSGDLLSAMRVISTRWP